MGDFLLITGIELRSVAGGRKHPPRRKDTTSAASKALIAECANHFAKD